MLDWPSFVATLHIGVEALDLPPDVEQAVLTRLIPALYLERVAGRSTHADTCNHVRRPDGTTAAERFFGRPHPALFDQVPDVGTGRMTIA